jgi:flavin-dependent dehydrogenase
MQAAARQKLPASSPVEHAPLLPDDKMYVVLNFVQLENPERDAPKTTEHWAYYKAWVGKTGEKDTVVIGAGANFSHAYAELCLERFAQNAHIPQGKLIRQERGVLPYRYAPYALCDDGFLSVGDSACMNKWVGEGICSGWVGAKLAAQTAAKALTNDAYPTKEALWEYSTQYNRGQAAEFAYINATTSNALDCSAEEMEYEFQHKIVFNDKTMTRLNRSYSGEMPPLEALQLFGKVAVGAITKHLRLKTIAALLRGVYYATLLRTHYRHFPQNPKGYAKWAAKADKLWKATGSIADATRRADPEANRIKTDEPIPAPMHV